VDPEGLCRERNLADLLGCSWLWGQSYRRMQKSGPIAGSEGELKARKQDADDE
jgi:hypothetical protein